MKVLGNIGQLATCKAEGGQGDVHSIADAALVWDEGVIVWAGPSRSCRRSTAAPIGSTPEGISSFPA